MFEAGLVELDPHGGTDRDNSVVDTVTVVTDGAASVDKCSDVRIVAGRPQPPPAEIPYFSVCALFS